MPSNPNSPIAAKLRELDMACPRYWNYRALSTPEKLAEHVEECPWSGHRLARELAKVAMLTQAKESLDIYDSLAWIGDNPAISPSLQREVDRLTAPLLEGVEDE